MKIELRVSVCLFLLALLFSCVGCVTQAAPKDFAPIHSSALSLKIPLSSTDNVQHLEFSFDGQEVATTLYDSNSQYRMVFFKAKTGLQLREWKQENSTSGSFALSPDSQKVAISGHNFVSLVSAKTGATLRKFAYPAHQNSHEKVQVHFSPDGKLLAAVELPLSQILVWDVASTRLLWTRQALRQEFFGSAFSPDSQLLASAGWGQRADKSLKIWDAKHGTLKYTLQKPVPLEAPLIFSRDGQTLISSGDSCVLQWNFRENISHRAIKPYGFCEVLGFTKDGRSLVSRAFKEIIVQDLRKNVISQRIDVGLGNYPALSAQGDLVATDFQDNTGRYLTIWQLTTP